MRAVAREKPVVLQGASSGRVELGADNWLPCCWGSPASRMGDTSEAIGGFARARYSQTCDGWTVSSSSGAAHCHFPHELESSRMQGQALGSSYESSSSSHSGASPS
jgi:hypothetical protein